MKTTSLRVIAIALLLLLNGVVIAADDFKDLNDEGSAEYDKGNFGEAAKLLEDARNKKPGDPTVNFNLGNVYHQQGDYEKADETYLNATMAEDSSMRAHAFYNIGNTHFRGGDYQKALDAYKRSLDFNPNDLDAKYNLELAQRRLEQQQQQQQQQCDNNKDQQEQQDQEQNQEQSQDQQGQDGQQEQDEQDQEPQENQQQQDQQQGQDEQQQQQQEQDDQGQQEEQDQSAAGEGEEEQDPEQQQQQASLEQVEMSEEDAERLLNAVTGNDREVLKKLIRQKSRASGYKGKDW